MSMPLLTKGFEVEMYTGRADGTVVGCAAEAARELAGFVTEPDQRNLEYTTPPDPSYERQLALLLEPRQRLRHLLEPRGLTLLPGSALSTGDSGRPLSAEPSRNGRGVRTGSRRLPRGGGKSRQVPDGGDFLSSLRSRRRPLRLSRQQHHRGPDPLRD